MGPLSEGPLSEGPLSATTFYIRIRICIRIRIRIHIRISRISQTNITLYKRIV